MLFWIVLSLKVCIVFDDWSISKISFFVCKVEILCSFKWLFWCWCVIFCKLDIVGIEWSLNIFSKRYRWVLRLIDNLIFGLFLVIE